MTDSLRGTGRTCIQIRSCIMAAMFGRRVAYITANQHTAKECHAYAVQLLNDAFTMPGEARLQWSASGNTIQFYDERGSAGVLRFISQQATENVNVGLRAHRQFTLVYDHHVLELQEQERLRLERVAAQEQIILLLKKHEWTGIQIQPGAANFYGTDLGARPETVAIPYTPE